MEIEVRQNKIWLIENGAPGVAMPECCGSRMMTVAEAMQNAGVGSREIYRLVEAGCLHFQETQKGVLLVCHASLSKF